MDEKFRYFTRYFTNKILFFQNNLYFSPINFKRDFYSFVYNWEFYANFVTEF